MRSLLEITDFSKKDLLKMLARIDSYVVQPDSWPKLSNSVASLFYEDSTRTRVSFELAALNLGMKTIQVDVSRSSENKGEELTDTIKTLHAMGINAFIIRHKEPKLIHELHQQIKTASFINAGSGMFAHPTQALLDLYTIKQRLDNFSQAKIVIVGDIKHSRVANSLISGLKLLDAKKIVCVSPDYFKPLKPSWQVSWEDNLDFALTGADVVVALRVQKERFKSDLNVSLDDYQHKYRLSKEKLAMANPGVFVMHPGPVNRGVEITQELADSEKSVILQQVRNGVFARMAVLSMLFDNRS